MYIYIYIHIYRNWGGPQVLTVMLTDSEDFSEVADGYYGYYGY